MPRIPLDPLSKRSATAAVVRVHLSGELDLLSAREAQRRLTELLRSSPGASLVVDLEGISFCDACGFRALAAAAEAARPPARVVFTRARPNVRRVFAVLDHEDWLLGFDTSAGLLPTSWRRLAGGTPGPEETMPEIDLTAPMVVDALR